MYDNQEHQKAMQGAADETPKPNTQPAAPAGTGQDDPDAIPF